MDEVVCVLGKTLSDMVCCSHVAPEHAHRWAQAATCRLARGRLWLRGRLAATREPSAFVRVQQRPARGRAGHYRNNNQALCGSVGAKKTMATMIVLLRAWYSHE